MYSSCAGIQEYSVFATIPEILGIGVHDPAVIPPNQAGSLGSAGAG